jgi:hypothetical protein
MSYTKRDSGFGESLSLGGFNIYLGLSNEKKIKGSQVFIENFTDKKLEEIFPKKNVDVRNVRGVQNIQNTQNIQHVQKNVQNIQHVQNIHNIQTTQNVQNVHNTHDIRVQDIQKNVEKPRDSIPSKTRGHTPFTSYLGFDRVNRFNSVNIVPIIVKSDSTTTNIPIPSAAEISINRSLQLIREVE